MITKHNPFVPREQRTAILTFDNGQRVRAEITLPGTDKPVWHADHERQHSSRQERLGIRQAQNLLPHPVQLLGHGKDIR